MQPVLARGFGDKQDFATNIGADDDLNRKIRSTMKDIRFTGRFSRNGSFPGVLHAHSPAELVKAQSRAADKLPDKRGGARWFSWPMSEIACKIVVRLLH